jgi:hypothetical protein
MMTVFPTADALKTLPDPNKKELFLKVKVAEAELVKVTLEPFEISAKERFA